MAEEENKVSEKSGGGKGLMVVLIALIVILILAVGGMAYFLFSNGTLNGQAGTATQEENADAKKDEGDNYKTSINDLVLNITNSKGREKLMKLSFTLKSTEKNIEAIVEEHKAEIVDIVISQISARSSEELLTVGGKALLKEELIDEINSILNEMTATNEDIKKDSIKQLYFTTFVIK
ncbi:flagellar basal body protein FliL [Malaciobacter mytili]|uniref:flagellar basal body-associated FliL family protein n=1 Tax=Malaciobacter mytili TaxID=603050 RepID=UPI00100A94E0|nr:flagellar basal body-associated FliL family protein [Malaciobacter mytili]RXI48875.1 flagellar basal body protein FliL [Malaciobacter mytili]